MLSKEEVPEIISYCDSHKINYYSAKIAYAEPPMSIHDNGFKLILEPKI